MNIRLLMEEIDLPTPGFTLLFLLPSHSECMIYRKLADLHEKTLRIFLGQQFNENLLRFRPY